MAQPALPLEAPPALAQDSIVVLRNAIWADFQRVLELKGGAASLASRIWKGLLAGIDFAELLKLVEVRPMTRAVREYSARLATR